MMLSGSDAFYQVLSKVRDANVIALRSAGVQPARVSIVPGAIAWDECDQCGLLALASMRHFLSDEFSHEVTGPINNLATQGSLLCADLVVQIIRCAPTPIGNDLAPSVTALDAAGKLVISDAYTIMCSTIETLTDLLKNGDIEDFLIRQQTFVGPAGSCVGSELQFVVGVLR